MRPIHDRMPVILKADSYPIWINSEEKSLDSLFPLLKPLDADEMKNYPVSTFVNNVKNGGPKCVMGSEDSGGALFA